MDVLNPYPTLMLDEAKAKTNIQAMAQKASKSGIAFRPHFKTHQSREIGDWFNRYNIDGITVSSLHMAKYFAEDGWQSITIAFPVNILEVPEINKLAASIDLRILVIDKSTITKLDQSISHSLGVYIELDPDYTRSGVSFKDFELIKELISAIEGSQHLALKGFYCHAGHSYRSRSTEQVMEMATPIVKQLEKLKAHFPYPICYGDTPSCSVLEDFGSIDQLSPGNFVFYDWIQTKIGSCIPDQIAVAMYCPVVAKYPERKELLIHGGAVHFSKDFDTLENGSLYFGQLVEQSQSGWGNPLEGCYLKSISQEHGIVACTNEFFENTRIGDHVVVLPIHSCLTADVMGGYRTLQGNLEPDHFSGQKFK